ncbi:hypothetical protein IEQ34_006209 [Dendrobium chrysotoxum]|uniref:Kinesin-like protein n=1 Tax=Dendrobium chrysotoxum TaxID=161865 RepID=A0AAV7HB14_DENCH|nr:hypothetical protein IEQ34_006209 [Dendrobium chrysotoxum]
MERIYVAVRARPLSPEESKTSPWRISGNSVYLHNQPTKFDFGRVFGEDCKTVDIFEARTKEIVASVVRGFNGTVFAYGQTSSGKTYTMRGSVKEPGIIPLSVLELFCSIEKEMDREFLVRMSYMEIYNEEINDLLAPEHRKLQIHESLERGIYVAGLKEEIVTSPEQVLELVEFAHRHIGETNMNLYSSRSHTIFRMIVESRERSEEGDSINCFDAVRVSTLNLVDLAGSERVVKTGAEGLRLKEGSHINKSLLTLGTVIKKLSDGVESQGGHVPYRDSKLTRILQAALGGNANTAIICNITLSQIHADETKSSLLFASRALQVKNCACVNEILTDAALLKRQKKEIEELRAKFLSSQSEHLEEEILNLRNTLLQSELEKERIALELEEEKKAKAHRDRRLLEQAKKIENLSSLILCSERNDRTTHSTKSNLEADILEAIEEEPELSLLHPSSELVQENEDLVDSIPFSSSLSEISDYTDRMECFSLPNAQALLNVTSRRKKHQNRACISLMKFGDVKIGELKISCSEVQSTPIKSYSSSLYHLPDGASLGHNNLTLREPEAIIVIKHLHEQIKSLEVEETSVQRNLDNVVALATEQNASFREKYDEVCFFFSHFNFVKINTLFHETESFLIESYLKFSNKGDLIKTFLIPKSKFRNPNQSPNPLPFPLIAAGPPSLFRPFSLSNSPLSLPNPLSHIKSFPLEIKPSFLIYLSPISKYENNFRF